MTITMLFCIASVNKSNAEFVNVPVKAKTNLLYILAQYQTLGFKYNWAGCIVF